MLRDDVKTVISNLEQVAAMGDLRGHVMLGKMYRRGLKVEKKPEKAMYHFKIVADAGNTEAMIAVGEMYAFGEGVSQSEEQARVWYQKAADGGDGFGMVALAKSYYWMKTRQGNEKAIYWAKEAIAHGKPDTSIILSELASDPKERAYWKNEYEKFLKTPLKELENTVGLMWHMVRI